MFLQDVLPIMFLLNEMKERGFQVICTAPHVYCKVFEDNSGALELACLLKLRPRTKHINVCYISENTCAQGRSKSSQLATRNRLLTPFNKSTPTKLFLAALSSHVQSVTQDSLVRECEIYFTMALTFQFREITWSLDLKVIREETVRLNL